MEMKLLLKLAYPRSGTPGGVFIGIRETGGQGTNPGTKRRERRGRTAAETRLGPRFCSPLVAACAALRAARGPVCPLSGSAPDFLVLGP